jgi:hypothetical protein
MQGYFKWAGSSSSCRLTSGHIHQCSKRSFAAAEKALQLLQASQAGDSWWPPPKASTCNTASRTWAAADAKRQREVVASQAQDSRPAAAVQRHHAGSKFKWQVVVIPLVAHLESFWLFLILHSCHQALKACSAYSLTLT